MRRGLFNRNNGRSFRGHLADQRLFGTRARINRKQTVAPVESLAEAQVESGTSAGTGITITTTSGFIGVTTGYPYGGNPFTLGGETS